MSPARSGMTLDVRNRQRSHKVNCAKLRQLALEVAADFQSLSIVLVSDPAMARFNRQYHATAGTTDVLSFDYGDSHGELIISVPQAVAQARQFRTTPSRELALYVVHGILLTPGPRRRMRAAERQWLRKLDFHGLLPVR